MEIVFQDESREFTRAAEPAFQCTGRDPDLTRREKNLVGSDAPAVDHEMLISELRPACPDEVTWTTALQICAIPLVHVLTQLDRADGSVAVRVG